MGMVRDTEITKDSKWSEGANPGDYGKISK